MMRQLFNPRGAMFGIDARIAVFVLALAALAVTAVQTNRVARDRTILTEAHLKTIEHAVGQYALVTGNDGHGMLIDYAEFLEVSIPDPTQDAWGNPLGFAQWTTTPALPDGSAETLHHFILVSAGPDGVMDSATSLASLAAWQAWAPVGDDLGRKFTTLHIRDELYRDRERRLQRIREALDRLATTRRAALVAFCDVGANQTHSDCNINGVSGYQTDEELSSHFYPRASSDSSTSKFYPVPLPDNTFTSADITSMQALLSLLGLPTALAMDGFDRILKYASNPTQNPTGPYLVRVWY